MNDRCDSCGDDGPGLITVQRIFVLFDEKGQPTGERPGGVLRGAQPDPN